jgi:hypothetical protein
MQPRGEMVPLQPGHRCPGVAAAAAGVASYEQNVAFQSNKAANGRSRLRVVPEIVDYYREQRRKHNGGRQWRSSSCKDYDAASATQMEPLPPLEFNDQHVLGRGRHDQYHPCNLLFHGTISSSSSRKHGFFACALYLLMGLSR